MSGLGDTLAGLAAIKKSLSLATDDSAEMVEARAFGPNPGALRMLFHVPDDLPRHAPLIVVLHGCTQSGAGYASAAGWLTLADRLGFAVLVPEQTAANNPNRCFNWFEPGDTVRGGGEAASIHAMVQHMIGAHRLDPKRVFITGLSAGGAMTAAMLAAYPETFAAGAVVAGLAVGVASNVQEALMAMRNAGGLTDAQLTARVTGSGAAPGAWPRLSIWHGAADHTVADANAEALQRQWTGIHGLPQAPDVTELDGRWTRTRWLDAKGAVVLERNAIAGLGHGAPLAAGGDDPIGHVAPYVLEAGVSSSLEIARFWGIAPAGAARESVAANAAAPARNKPAVGDTVMETLSAHVPAEVGAVIGKALKAAGLMR